MEYTYDANKLTLHPQGRHRGTIIRIEEITSRFGTRQVEITVETMSFDGDIEIRYIKDWAPINFKPESALGKIYTAISGQEIVPGLSIDTDKDLLNQSALVDIEHYVKKTDGKMGMRIREWLPLN